jgi:PEGA domain-containing protein
VPRPVLPDVISRLQQSTYRQPTYSYSSTSRGRRSYYVFAPRFNIGTGLLVGYPVAYPYPYAYPFIYDAMANAAPYQESSTSLSMSAPARNTYLNTNTGGVTPAATPTTPIECGVDPNASTPCGGVSFDVFPGEAQVSVEGVFVGTVDSFSATRPPLVLAPGRHYIELRMPGYRTEVFDVTVNTGEVIPYQGSLEPLRTQ